MALSSIDFTAFCEALWTVLRVSSSRATSVSLSSAALRLAAPRMEFREGFTEFRGCLCVLVGGVRKSQRSSAAPRLVLCGFRGCWADSPEFN